MEPSKKIISLKDYGFILFRNKTFITIPTKILSENFSEINSKIKFEPKKGIPNWVYFLTFIPNIGFFAGIVFLIMGIVNKVKKTLLWGIFGIVFTFLFWFVTISISENTDASKKGDIQMSKYQLNEIVKNLTYYKSKNKIYPDSLGQLKKQDEFFNDIDNLSISPFPWKKSKPQKFYYKKVNDTTYILKSIGIDRILNTKDDIYPDLK